MSCDTLFSGVNSSFYPSKNDRKLSILRSFCPFYPMICSIFGVIVAEGFSLVWTCSFWGELPFRGKVAGAETGKTNRQGGTDFSKHLPEP